MGVSLIFKIAAVGILVSILSQVLKHSGREEQAFLTSFAGLLLVLFWILPEEPTNLVLNACYYGLNTLCILLIFHRFLWNNLRVFAQSWRTVLKNLPAALVAYYAISMVVNAAILLLMPDFANQNDATVGGILDEH